MDYTTLSPSDIRAELVAIAADAEATFTSLDGGQLNWQPAPSRWSVAQCLEHLLSANRQMVDMSQRALDGSRSRTVWQRLPGWPRLMGRLLVRTQSPNAARKFKAVAASLPSSSAIAADVVGRFIDHQREMATRLDAVAGRDLAGTIMTSPFAAVVTYSVLDGWRLIVAHGQRHVQQAKRVMETPGFPR